MNRRTALQMFTGGGGMAATLAGTAAGPLQAAQAIARRGLPPVKITDVKVILTQPAGDQLVIVKVMTSEPGLYGLGCATHRERPLVVATAIEQYLKPFVIGRNCDEIEDIWQSAYVSSYFRSGVSLNNALSGIDGALWDILASARVCPSMLSLEARYERRSRFTVTQPLKNCRILKIRSESGRRRAIGMFACSLPYRDFLAMASRPKRRRTCSSFVRAE